MDVLFLATVFAAVFVVGDAIHCHDCTSWNPYCREHVQVPFPDAVAHVECKKSQKCFVKRDKQGVLSRGCGDWLEDGEVDSSYEGCRVQETEWSGKEIWCFCKSEFCNAGPVDEMGDHMDVHPKPGDYDGSDSSDNVAAPAKEKSKHQFDDFSANYFLQQERHLANPAWQMWFWHAESDRPRWTPPGQGHTPSGVTQQPAAAHDAAPSTASPGPQEGQTQSPWQRLFPWWYGRVNWERMADAEPPRTPTSTPLAEQWWEQKAENEVQQQQEQQQAGEEDKKQKSPFDPSSPDMTPEVDPLPGQDIDKPDFYCWDCYSDSPLCGERVDTQRAMYLGKTSCPRTSKCFVRKDKDVIYRGCADGWTGSVISTDYVGCRQQRMWDGDVEWCFCSASLCNSDSLADIQSKYVTSLAPQPFRKLPDSQNLTRVTAPSPSPSPSSPSAKKTSAVPATTAAKPAATTATAPSSSPVTKATARRAEASGATTSTATRETTPTTTAAPAAKDAATGKPPVTSQEAAANGKATRFEALVGR